MINEAHPALMVLRAIKAQGVPPEHINEASFNEVIEKRPWLRMVNCEPSQMSVKAIALTAAAGGFYVCESEGKLTAVMEKGFTDVQN